MSLKEKAAKASKLSKKEKPIKKSTHVSAEYIVDSDVEADLEANGVGSSRKPDGQMSNKNVAAAKKLKRKATDVQESSSPKRKRTISSPAKAKKNHQDDIEEVVDDAPRVNGKSTSRSKESPDDSIHSSDADSDTAPAQVNGNGTSKGVANESPKRQQGKIVDPRFTLDVSDSSVDESESESEADHQTSEKSVSSDDPDGETDVVPSGQSNTTELPPYLPPQSFSIASINDEATSQIRSILAPENLQGKYIWHITAPASVPISDIKRMTRTNILEGEAILTHKGSRYGLNLNDDRSIDPRILIPTRRGSKYQLLSRRIDANLHLQQIIEVPEATGASASSVESSTSISGARKAILKQPVGLKMRYRPFGDIEEYENDRQAAQQAKQRIQNTQIPIPSLPAIPVKKAKKSKKASQSDHALTEWVNPLAYTAPIVVGQDSQHSIALPSETLKTSQPDPEKGETREERAVRKARKAARKEEKRQHKEAKARLAAESQEKIKS